MLLDNGMLDFYRNASTTCSHSDALLQMELAVVLTSKTYCLASHCAKYVTSGLLELGIFSLIDNRSNTGYTKYAAWEWSLSASRNPACLSLSSARESSYPRQTYIPPKHWSNSGKFLLPKSRDGALSSPSMYHTKQA